MVHVNINDVVSPVTPGGLRSRWLVIPPTVRSGVQDDGLTSHTFKTIKYDDEARRKRVSHRPVQSPCMITGSNTKQATIHCSDLWWLFCRHVLSPHTSSLLSCLYIHKCYIYISMFSFNTNIYKDNYDSLIINEQLIHRGWKCWSLYKVVGSWLGFIGTRPEYNKVQIISRF